MAQGSLIIFEDEHLLVINKPAGMNTHAPSPFAGEGIYEWLKHREPRWSKLAIIHRLDKETSGVMVFGKTQLANRSLTEQFTQHSIRKKYLLITDRPIKFETRTVVSSLVRVGEKYSSRPLHAGGEPAETNFRIIKSSGHRVEIEAAPVTGRTHQIRAQAAAEGFPILGDVLYGGTEAARVCLHAVELILKHPLTGAEMKFNVAADFETDARLALRELLVGLGDCPLTPSEGAREKVAEARDVAGQLFQNPVGQFQETDAYRLIHGAADGWADWYVDRLGDYLLSESEQPLTAAQLEKLESLMKLYATRGVYHKILSKQVRRTSVAQASPQVVLGDAASGPVVIHENGVRFELNFNEGYSVGLFLDQRDNRRRLLTYHLAADFPLFQNSAVGAEVLNAFAYTCAFSVCAAKAGARATSLDLSKKYLEWGRRNFALNQLDPAKHDFIYGDVFDWFRRLTKKGRAYDLVIFDPPTFSQSKETGLFQAEKDFGKLLKAALPLVKPGGVLFASTNAARLDPETFLQMLAGSVSCSGRKILKQHYVPQPPDFPVHRNEPAYLKTVWARIA